MEPHAFLDLGWKGSELGGSGEIGRDAAEEKSGFWVGQMKMGKEVQRCAPGQRTPFVEGMPVPRGSGSTAARRARAHALKIASTM